MFGRPQLRDSSGLVRDSRQGDGYLAMLNPSTMVTDAAMTITVANIAGGLILRSGATAGRIDTSPTAALLTAAFPNMDVGDTLLFSTSVQVAFAITYAGGAGVTASGNLVIAANGKKDFVLIKDSATAWRLIGL